MPSSSSRLSATTRCHVADRGVEIVALLVMDLRDAHEIGALLVRRRRLARRALSSAATRSSQRCWLSRMPMRASSAETSDGSLSTRRSHSDSARSVSPSDSASLAASREDRGARGVVGFEVRLALEDGEALLRLVGLGVERGEAAGDDELLVLGGAADAATPRRAARSRLACRACDRGACARPRRAARPCASDRSSSPRAAAATPFGVALVVAALLGELAQLLLGRPSSRARSRAAPRSDPSRPADRRARRAGCRLLRAARACSRGSSAMTLLEDADDLARARRRVVVRAQQIERGVADAGRRLRRLDDALEQRARSRCRRRPRRAAASTAASAFCGSRRLSSQHARDARAAASRGPSSTGSRGGLPTARSDRPSARGARAGARGRC